MRIENDLAHGIVKTIAPPVPHLLEKYYHVYEQRTFSFTVSTTTILDPPRMMAGLGGGGMDTRERIGKEERERSSHVKIMKKNSVER